MSERADTVTFEESMTIEQSEMISVPRDTYENLVRESERMRILRNYFWFSSDKYGSTYSIGCGTVAAIFDDEEFLLNDYKAAFTKKIGKMVHDAAGAEGKESA